MHTCILNLVTVRLSSRYTSLAQTDSAPPLHYRHHLSYDDCLKNKREIYHHCMTVVYTQMWAVLKLKRTVFEPTWLTWVSCQCCAHVWCCPLTKIQRNVMELKTGNGQRRRRVIISSLYTRCQLSVKVLHQFTTGRHSPGVNRKCRNGKWPENKQRTKSLNV